MTAAIVASAGSRQSRIAAVILLAVYAVYRWPSWQECRPCAYVRTLAIHRVVPVYSLFPANINSELPHTIWLFVVKIILSFEPPFARWCHV